MKIFLIVAEYEGHKYYYEPCAMSWELESVEMLEYLHNFKIPKESLEAHLREAKKLWHDDNIKVMEV